MLSIDDRYTVFRTDEVEQLDRLPARSLVLDGGENVWRKLVNGKWDYLDGNGEDTPEDSQTVIWWQTPSVVTVLWQPPPAEQEPQDALPGGGS